MDEKNGKSSNNKAVIKVTVEVDSTQIDAAIAKAKELAAILKDCKMPALENG